MEEKIFFYSKRAKDAVDVVRWALQHEEDETAAIKALEERWRGSSTAGGSGALPDQDPFVDGLRLAAVRLAREAAEAGSSMMQYQLPGAKNCAVSRLLGMTLALCASKMIEGGVIFNVLEDLIHISTVRDCEELFDWLDDHTPQLGSGELFVRGKLIVLRTCNELLRRFSKTDATQLCGRVLLLLARLLPLNDRSGLNLRMAPNLDHPIKIADVQEGEKDTLGNPIDVALYKRFWGLQNKFQDYSRALHSMENWKAFMDDIKAVIKEFRARSIGVPAEGILSASGDITVAYLTSPHLFSLQLRDSAFRRHFLVQCMATLRGMLLARDPQEELKPRHTEDINAVLSDVAQELGMTDPAGNDFSAAVQELLAREDKWIEWKGTKKQPGSERAKDFVRPPLDALPPPAEGAPTVPPLKRLRLRGPPTDPEGPRVSLGVPGMDELWNMWGDNTEMLAAEDRGHRRGLAGMVEDVASQMDPALGVPEKHRRKNSPDFKWAFLRALYRSHLDLATVQGLPQDVLASGADPDLEAIVYYLFPDKLSAAGKAAFEAARAKRAEEAARKQEARGAAQRGEEAGRKSGEDKGGKEGGGEGAKEEKGGDKQEGAGKESERAAEEVGETAEGGQEGAGGERGKVAERDGKEPPRGGNGEGENKGGAAAKPGESKGGATAKPGESKGGAAAKPGESKGGATAKPGESKGGAAAKPGEK